MKITFSNLSWPLKAAVLMAWALGILYVILFLVGFIIGLVMPV